MPAAFTPVRNLILWVWLFLVCLGLGYPTLNRYNPSQSAGTHDSLVYAEVVQSGPKKVIGPHRNRVLIPYFEKPTYFLAKNRVRTWNPVFLGLLVSNSFFLATGMLFLIHLGYRLIGSPSIALPATAIYLLNFSVANLHLSGLVDSSESCMMIVLIWSLSKNLWWPLPLLSALGVLGKETFLPISFSFAIGWWLADQTQEKNQINKLLWILAMGLTALIVLCCLQSLISERQVWPWNMELLKGSFIEGFFPRLVSGVFHFSFWYIFIWLFPLGIWKLKIFPRVWLWASVLSTLVVLILGGYVNVDPTGTFARTIFNVTGPLLSLSAACLLAEWVNPSG